MKERRERVLLAYSGGLDTSYLVAWLTHAGMDVATLTVDCGGFAPADRERIEARARAHGASEVHWIDARRELFDRVLRWLLAGNVRRGETYPLCVAAERGLQAELLASEALAGGFDAVAHGCTGAGNDQVRFEAALAVVAEGLRVLAPIRDHKVTREESVAWLAEHGLAIEEDRKAYSVNAGLWGVTIGGAETHSSDRPLPEHAWRWTGPANRVEGERTLLVEFAAGVPVAVDGVVLEPVDLVEELNAVAGAHGVGRGYHLGDTILGHKGRIGFEAPAADVLLTAHRELEKLVLTEEQRFWKDHLGDVYGRLLHRGQFHEPMLRDAEAFFASTQGRVTGTVRVRLAAGQAQVEGVSSPFSMMAVSRVRYGEEPDADFDARGAVRLARTMAEPARLHARAAAPAPPEPTDPTLAPVPPVTEAAHAGPLAPVPAPRLANAGGAPSFVGVAS